MPNPYVNKVTVNNSTVIDLTSDTVTPSVLLQGYTAHDASGAPIVGTATGGGDLVVTLTNVNGVWTPDKTLSEIAEAYGDGVKIAVMADDNSVVADGIFDDGDNCLYYTVDYFDYITSAYMTQWYILDSNGITDDGNTVYYSTVFATAVASDIAQGKTAYGPNGEIVGTATPETPTLQAKTNISPTTSSQTITADSGYDGLSSVQINAMPSGTAGTPTATKGTVSNHAVSVTPSVTNATGYIAGGTKTGTAVSVSASELVSGTYTVSASGTHDVTDYASASVAAGSATASATKGSVSNHSVTVTPSVTRTAGYVTAGSADGTAVTVSASELVSGSRTITANGTGIDVTEYASVDVAVAGGSSSWTKVAETSYTASTTGTSATTIATWETGHSELWTSDKIVYVRIRDTAGKRAGYFYGTDTFFMNMYPKNGSTSTSSSTGTLTEIWSYTTGGKFSYRYGYGTTGYGVFADIFYKSGNIRIRQRYNSDYSLTINGTYKVEVYLLDPAGGVPIFG